MRAFGDDKLAPNSFRAVHEGTDFSLAPRLEKQEAVVAVFARYTELLAILAGAGTNADFDRGLQELSGSLQRVAMTQDVDPASVKISTTLVDGIADASTESLRRNSLRRAMDAASPGIEALAKRFSEDQERLIRFVDVMRLRLFMFAAIARPEERLRYERHQFDRMIGTTAHALDNVERALKELQSTADAVSPAHRALRAALDHREPGTDALRSLVARAQRLNAFYRSLPTPESR
jgi:ABC-type transporter Mla subunit MlaD